MNAQIENATLIIEVLHCNNSMSSWLRERIETSTVPDHDVMMEEFEKLHMLLNINQELIKSLFEENSEIMDRVENIVQKLESNSK